MRFSFIIVGVGRMVKNYTAIAEYLNLYTNYSIIPITSAVYNLVNINIIILYRFL